MSGAHGATHDWRPTCAWMHERDSRTHEWDFRAGLGSRITDSLVAMEVASGRAGEEVTS